MIRSHHDIEVMMVSAYPAARCGVSTYTLEILRGLSSVRASHCTIDMRTAPLSYIAQVMRALLRLAAARPDVIHLQYTPTTIGPAGLLLACLARATGIKVVITAHERPSTYERRMPAILRLPFRSFERVLLRSAHRVLVLSMAHAAELRRTYGIAAELQHLGVREVRRAKASVNSKRTVTFAGFLRPGKGIEDLIQAAPFLAEKLGDVRIQMVGGVSRRDRAYVEGLRRQAEVASMADSCSIALVTDSVDDEFERLVTSSDLFIFPARSASQSGTINLALEARIPVVSTSGTGVGDVVAQYGLGSVYPAGDVAALADSVAMLLNDPASYSACQSNIERFVQFAGWGAVTERHVRVYQELQAA